MFISRKHGTVFSLTVFLLCVFSNPALSTAQQERVTTAQNRTIKKIKTGIDRAGKLFENNKMQQSAKAISELAEEMEELLKDNPSRALLTAVEEQHARLQQARDALVGAGQSLPTIVALPDPGTDPNSPVSFTREVALILNNNCGTCHVQRSRGKFSMASFNSLAEGIGGAPVVVPGKPEESRLIEVIEEEAMPPSGDGIPDAQLARLKKWIADGAYFDGEDRDAQVAMMSRQAQPEIQISRPVGNETVSFSRDIAPVLMQNCLGCHYEARNVRGGLRMDNFRQLLQGGESGRMIKAGDGANSLLVKRLTATDNTRMPQRRQPLSKEVIDKVIKWIDEGARFDGRGGRLNLREVTAIASSEAATHEQLTADRQAGVLRDWKKVMSDVAPVQTTGTEVFVVSTADNTSREALSRFGDSISTKIKAELFLDDDKALVKGLVSIFVFDRRYDYSEFGKMIETRELPKSWRSHWGYDTVTAYTAVLMPEGAKLEELKPELTQRLASVAAASLGTDVPEWFADGLGYVIAEKIADDKSMVVEWRNQSAEAVSEMTNATDFMRGRLANDKSGLVAYAFVKALKDADKKEFKKFLMAIQDGTPFNEAFATSWSVPPIELIQRQFGGGRGRNNRQRRNRRGR